MAIEELLYLRQAELIVGPKVDSKSPLVSVDAISFKTRIKFSVKTDESSNANKATIKVYNLNQDSKAFLETENLVCFLNAGYEATGLANLFFGDIIRVKDERSGPDIITTIEAGDAEKNLREANVQIGLAAGATNLQIIEQAVAKLKVALAFKTDIKSKTYQNGFSYSGSVKKLLNDLGKEAGFKWSIQNGELLILGELQTDQQEAVFLSKDTGLIGFPTKTKKRVEFLSLLNPKIRPGRGVVLESSKFRDGQGTTLKVIKADFEGDTHEGPWQVKVEGEAIK